jgi:hypothetical protein
LGYICRISQPDDRDRELTRAAAAGKRQKALPISFLTEQPQTITADQFELSQQTNPPLPSKHGPGYSRGHVLEVK